MTPALREEPPNEEIIFAVDPGETTGFAIFAVQPDRIEAGQLPHDEFEDHAAATIMSGASAGLTVVVEAFTITQQTLRKTRTTWSLDQIGVLKFLARRHGAKFVLQTAADAKSFSTDEKLRALDWYIPGQGHANDALRHLLLYVVRSGLIDVKRLMRGEM